jgi:hypothetical protein
MLVFNPLLVSTSNVSQFNFINLKKPGVKHLNYLYIGLVIEVLALMFFVIKSFINKSSTLPDLFKYCIILAIIAVGTIAVIFVRLAKNQSYYEKVANNLQKSEEIFDIIKTTAMQHSKELDPRLLLEGYHIGHRLILFDEILHFDVYGINNYVEFIQQVVQATLDSAQAASRTRIEPVDVSDILENARFFDRSAIRPS